MIDVSNPDLDIKGLPTREGVYSAVGLYEPSRPGKIEVRQHQKRGPCCDASDYSNVRDYSQPIPDSVVYTDSWVPVSWTGLTFLSRIGGLPKDGAN